MTDATGLIVGISALVLFLVENLILINDPFYNKSLMGSYVIAMSTAGFIMSFRRYLYVRKALKSSKQHATDNVKPNAD